MNFKRIFFITFALCFLAFSSCTPRRYRETDDRLTVAKAQREIRIGMSSTEVVEVLGSPNMVTTDEQRRETWVYDRISTTVDSSSRHHGVWVLLYDFSSNDNTYSTSQKTLTIIVKFDGQGRVRDFAYRSSAF